MGELQRVDLNNCYDQIYAMEQKQRVVTKDIIVKSLLFCIFDVRKIIGFTQ